MIAAAMLAAAAKLGGEPVELPAGVTALAERLEREFLENANRSNPLGFYIWNRELVQLFRRDRMLQVLIPAAHARPLDG